MNYINFENSSLEEKAKFVWENSTFIESTIHYNFRVNLYAINKQFVEVYYEPQNNDIERITFANEQDMKKYTSKIVLNL